MSIHADRLSRTDRTEGLPERVDALIDTALAERCLAGAAVPLSKTQNGSIAAPRVWPTFGVALTDTVPADMSGRAAGALRDTLHRPGGVRA
ncbi:hypothetical protein [Azotobacter vinelandii]|uniref:hypothetical protein n=1 Tax=Azotobacter vinelandii TaxID=354 RepID=UPI0026656AC5|nr:hypothetical protein [Azotobacter vinelandii]WKN23714.1 hypothetical protein AVAEIV_001820 [Azotobacter vinelandii]